MKVVFKDAFIAKLEDQVDYIANNSPAHARKFKSELISLLKRIPQNPYQFRPSIYFNDENIRDLIFKGYTIVFKINNNTIEVFGFVKYQNNP
ncbi:type II toxin-antitoxin system RelE/ParE family toxin [Carboxylicivirga marina]|uniref:Type II toxin-antitoxin system RelE/ParE family toxin n=1 Tax=Carboxylicivirga marina TaxID=2800988 RepID=A0ABS1HJ24_9BACT|nr:type II toxin-antitoxin system RelE/ParE family toxin [Carboxylicivirga marina]MBK3517688.1 type II toxin-antitoxin system RelE/ParE family toxin [Carboxylicivirga marina]